jgi:hypothetical protein
LLILGMEKDLSTPSSSRRLFQHGIPVVGMEDQGLRASATDALPQAGSADEISRDLGVFPFGDIPGHDLAAPDIDHQIEVEPHPSHAGGQVGDVPAPDLIRPVSPQARNGTLLLRKACPPAEMGLTMGMEHPIEAALRADVEPSVRKDRHNLPGRQGCEFRLEAGEQDPLALLLGEAVRHLAWTAYTAIQAVPITRELTPPALQCRQSDAQQLGELAGPCTGCHAGIEDLQGLAPILG